MAGAPSEAIFKIALLFVLLAGPIGYLIALFTGPRNEVLPRSRYFFFLALVVAGVKFLHPGVDVIRQTAIDQSWWPPLLWSGAISAAAGYAFGILSLLRSLDFSGRRWVALIGLVPIAGGLILLFVPPRRRSREKTALPVALGWIAAGIATIVVVAAIRT